MKPTQFTLPWAVIAAALFPAVAPAFNPPVDTAGPLRVRVEGPDEVTRADTPLKVRVTADNRGDRKIDGTVRLGLIDGWKSEPAGDVPLAVEPNATAKITFRVLPAGDSVSGHYPIHAFAQFRFDGQTMTAHPILIVPTKFPGTPSPAAPPWRPFELAEDSSLALWQLPVSRAVIAVFGAKPRPMPVGWQGSDGRTGATLRGEQVVLAGQGRSALGLHPPWREGRVGTIAVEFPLALPRAKPLRLAFANGLAPDGHGDGVTFRVRVLPWEAPDGELGQVVYERHTDAKTWQAAEADLSAFAGRKVRLQLESHPGPKNDTGWDHSYWAEPTLVAGRPAGPPPCPPRDDSRSRLLGRLARGKKTYEVRLWPGRRGLLDAVVGFDDGSRRLFFRGFEVRVPDGRLDDPRSPVVLLGTREEPCAGGRQVRHQFRGPGGTFDLVARLWVEHEVLRATFRLENAPPPEPWRVVYLQDVAAGPWSEAAERVYAGAGNVLRKPGAFRLNFDGHRLSTSFVGLDFAGGGSLVQGVDVPPELLDVRPAERHYSLHAPHTTAWTFIPAENVWDGARRWHDVNGLKAADGVPRLAGRFVFDLWGGRYAESAELLRRAFRYGLTDSLVVWHDWQRWGYDYRLPEIFPPNARLGTPEEMRDLVRTCTRAGALFAPHDNYIDFYPDAAGFSYRNEIAFGARGEPVRAWYNEGRAAQSYRFRADRVEPYLKGNLDKVRAGLAPTAYFIDVWSSIAPYDYWTADGRFFDRVRTRDTWGRHFAWISAALGPGAPQISESGHDQLIGRLDGAQANHLRVGKPLPGRHSGWTWDVPCADAERTPWFDAAHHDRFVLHGAGYPGRYEGGLEPSRHGLFSDDYVATEVLTGHPAMVSRPFGRDVVRTYWLLHELMRALASRRIEAVEYAGGDLHRQHVVWGGGGQVWVNRGASDWDVEGVTLPEYGFYARVPTDEGAVEASLARRGGRVAEMVRSPSGLYVNGRGPDAEVTDFGAVLTGGGCRLSREGAAVVVTPLPADRPAPFEARLRWSKLPWQLPEPTHVERLAEDGRVLAREPLRREGGLLVVTCDEKAFCCRLLKP